MVERWTQMVKKYIYTLIFKEYYLSVYLRFCLGFSRFRLWVLLLMEAILSEYFAVVMLLWKK